MGYEAMRKRHAGEGGFTLIELLIVIVILGILAAVVVFAVGGISDKGKSAACKSDVKNVEVAQEAYYAGGNLGNGTLCRECRRTGGPRSCSGVPSTATATRSAPTAPVRSRPARPRASLERSRVRSRSAWVDALHE